MKKLTTILLRPRLNHKSGAFRVPHRIKDVAVNSLFLTNEPLHKKFIYPLAYSFVLPSCRLSMTSPYTISMHDLHHTAHIKMIEKASKAFPLMISGYWQLRQYKLSFVSFSSPFDSALRRN